jgi:ABC-type glycerol-3-phosphate transport system permease component
VHPFSSNEYRSFSLDDATERGAAAWNVVIVGTFLFVLPHLVVLILLRKPFADGLIVQATK